MGILAVSGVILLVRGILAVVLSLAVASTAFAQQKTYRIGYLLSTNSQLGAGASAFADEVAKRTGGRIHIEQYPNSTLGGEVEMLDGLKLGSVDFAMISGAALPNVLPEMGVFSIPFLFRDADHAHRVLDSALGQAYLDKLREKGVVGLAWGENGMRQLTNAKHPIRTPDDVKGLKLRLPQSEVMVAGFKALGAETAAIGFPQLFAALQTGQVDGEENPIATILSAKFSSVQKYLTLSSHVYDPAAILVSGESWKEFSEADRAILIAAAKAGAEASRHFAAEAQKNGVEELKKQGMEVVEQIDRAAFVAAMQSVRPEYEKKFGTEVLSKIDAIK
jgi:tripartite ATP-independent transporter DctP family solute receptor